VLVAERLLDLVLVGEPERVRVGLVADQPPVVLALDRAATDCGYTSGRVSALPERNSAISTASPPRPFVPPNANAARPSDSTRCLKCWR
jgi:hypothetical protein